MVEVLEFGLLLGLALVLLLVLEKMKEKE